ncbi:23S rRNA (guanosine2251-2'-O)-methyltransferase [Spiroplasma corruscae]|uniref:23S rRNA (Guanosine2251-2'-O)-methyltransferase n=1 Tax=Spiroplasma corruscae TaxID=216934 RepID=A0A222EMU5_9MOLU|nr:23S rRNA (guanosine(2251)-2'-O)-methyltransferase RlmB [Spiroplasma corruscae]ASP27805.1 23S rRNA (guanosine2251-2'-O)-methyltransferase [Spiroplasma corruscae]
MKELIAYGKNVVENILIGHPKKVKRVYILKGLSFTRDAFSSLKNNNIEWTTIEKEEFTKITKDKSSVHQGYLAILKDFNYRQFEYIIREDCKMILVLDRIQDPQNFGAIIRTSSLLGVDAIIVKSINQSDITPVVIKASAGTIFNVPIIKVNSLVNSLINLKEKGFWIFSSALVESSVNMDTLDTTGKKVIVIGNEGSGVSNGIINISDFIFKISTNNFKDSLNVSVACGIILYKFFNNKK